MSLTASEEPSSSPQTTVERLKTLVDSGQLEAGDLLVGEPVRARAAAWEWVPGDGCAAAALVRPRTTEQLSRVLEICHDEGQPVVTHGGVTGLVQGSVAAEHEIVVSLERMTAIEEVDEVGQTVTAQAGCTLQQVQEAADAVGLKYGIDIGSRGQCTVGGNIATNAGGNNVIRWGMTRQQVVGLEAVLADGTVISDLSKMLKNNAGYDLKQLFIGTEGTLGLVTRAVLRLVPKPTSANTGLLAVESFEGLGKVLRRAHAELGADLSAFEVMWNNFYRLVTTPPAVAQPPLEQSFPYYVLLEAQGTDPERDGERFRSTVLDLMDEGLVADSVVSMGASDRQRLWDLRDDVEQMGQIAPFFIFDVSLPISAMEAYVAEVNSRLEADWDEPCNLTFGHLGDGNLHFAIGVGDGSDVAHHKVERAVYEPLEAIGGSVAAEHGIGIEKQPYLGITRSDAQIDLMRTLKAALDPKNILNPGRVIPSS